MKTNRRFSLRNVNRILIVVIGIFCIFLIVFCFRMALGFQTFVGSSEQYVSVSNSALLLQNASDYLTEEARLFVLSGEKEYFENYFNEVLVTCRREKAIEVLKTAGISPNVIEKLEQAVEKSRKLEKLECYAMKLAVEAKHYDEDESFVIPDEVKEVVYRPEDRNLLPEYKQAKAWLMLFSDEYLTEKRDISVTKEDALSELSENIQLMHNYSVTKLKNIFIQLMLCVAAIFVMEMVYFFGIIRYIIKPLYRFISSIKKNEKLGTERFIEWNILSGTYNEMYDLNAANQVLLRHKAEHDELTGLLNRTAFNQIKTALSKTEERIALLLVDVDKFKDINDTYGHPVGDLALKRIADALSGSFRSIDYIARVGGDEFVVLLTNCDKNEMKTRALITKKLEDIRKNLAPVQGEVPSITLSIGIAFSHTGYTDDLYGMADFALYQVKKNGKNNYKFAE